MDDGSTPKCHGFATLPTTPFHNEAQISYRWAEDVDQWRAPWACTRWPWSSWARRWEGAWSAGTGGTRRSTGYPATGSHSANNHTFRVSDPDSIRPVDPDQFLVIKTLDPDWIRIGIQPKMLGPDPYQSGYVAYIHPSNFLFFCLLLGRSRGFLYRKDVFLTWSGRCNENLSIFGAHQGIEPGPTLRHAEVLTNRLHHTLFSYITTHL